MNEAIAIENGQMQPFDGKERDAFLRIFVSTLIPLILIRVEKA